MPQNKSIAVEDLKLDLSNYRTVPQSNEVNAINAMIRVSPDRFWALMGSLLDGGYLPTENVIVLKNGPDLIVKEGNRRVAALKLILGNVSSSAITIPDHIQALIAGLAPQWKTDNKDVPCAIYNAGESVLVDRIVTMAHGKGEKAGRDQWSAVARARHNRNVNAGTEPALDVLESYLKHGGNITAQQRERWAGIYPFTVLDEALKKLAPRLDANNAPDLSTKYPDVPHREPFEAILHAIGMEEIGFKELRSKAVDFALKYGLPAAPPPATSPATTTPTTTPPATSKNPPTVTTPTGAKIVAVAISDPRAVTRALKKFQIRGKGNNRDKVVTLRDEALKLKIDNNPIAFCFLLRSMFEISAKAYCDDHAGTVGAPKAKNAKGEDRRLAETLKDVTNHLTNDLKDAAMSRVLHGAITEIAKPEGLLSVTSLNNLVHNPHFSLTVGDICIVFGNIFPLLEAMNQ